MKVKDLVEELKKLPQGAEVTINLRQSENMIEISDIKTYKSAVIGCKETENVEIVANWHDFKLDEEEMYFCEKDLEEEARQDALDTQVDIYLGK